jgi:protein O-mannosyl-transferase
VVAAKRRKLHKPVPAQRYLGLHRVPTKRILLFGFLLAIATLALYYPITGHPFVTDYDDGSYVTNNLHVRDGLSWNIVRWAFTTFNQANWHPLTWLSHALDCQLFGLSSSGHHGTNLLLAIMNVVLLFWVLRRATGWVGRSAMVAALFALHPINVESVVWVAERKNLLSMFFFLLALGAYRWYATRPRAGRYTAVAVLYALGLMAKPQVVTFPFVLLLWDYWPLERMAVGTQAASPSQTVEPAIPPKSFSWLLLEKLPLLALSAAAAVVTMIAQRLGGGINPDIPLSARLGNAIVSYARYLGKALWPSRLAPMYPHPGAWPIWQILAALVLLLAISALVFAGRKRRYLVTGWLWFLGTLVPMIGLVQVGKQAMADRYAYLPFLGLFIMICWGAPDVYSKARKSSLPLAPRIPEAQQYVPSAWLTGISAAVLLVLAVIAHRQIGYWSDNVALWSHSLQVTSDNYEAEEDLADALARQGHHQEALQHYYRATALDPSSVMTHMYIGRYEQENRNFPAAIKQYQQVIALTEKDAGENGKLRAAAFANMGHAYHMLGDLVPARENLQAAVTLNPQDVLAWVALGLIQQKFGDLNLAVQSYSEAVKLNPSDVGYLLLARALELSKRKDEANAAMQQARSLSQNFDQALRNAARLAAQ